MRQQNEPLTNEERLKWPYGQPIPMGIMVGNVTPQPEVNAVMVQLVDGRPVVSVLVNNASKKDELEALAHRIINSGVL